MLRASPLLQKVFIGFVVGAAIATLFSFLFLIGIFSLWQNKASDALFRNKNPDPRIAIITIDDKSIQSLGRWPWNRSIYGRLFTLLNNPESEPAATGVDVTFSEPSSANEDDALATALQKMDGRVVLANEVVFKKNTETAQEILKPLPMFLTNAQSGMVNVIIDEDDVVRRFPLFLNIHNQQQNHFAFEILQTAERHATFTCAVCSETALHAWPQFSRINFIGPPHSFREYSFADVLNGKINPAQFKNKIVLIGATAHDLHDEQLTPVFNTPMSGVEIQANILQTLMSGKFLRDENKMMTVVTVFAFGIFLSLVFIFSRVRKMIIVTFITLFAYFLYSFFSFDAGIIRDLIFPPLVIFAAFLCNIIYKYLSETQQKRFIRKALAYYLSPAVMRDVLNDPSKLSLGGTRCQMTVLFSDIAGFTSISELLAADTLAHLLNIYLTQMTDLVFQYNGVLDKYIGDAVMAFWGAPVIDKNHALHACQTALAMQEKIQSKKMQAMWDEHHIKHFDVRIGIHSGEMIVGNMGSQSRFDYTVIGDNVNLGSRLEGLNKEYGTHIIISENTYASVKNEVIARRLDTVAVKGKQKGVGVYELRGLGKASAEEQKLLDAFETARALYEKGNFKKALTEFQKIYADFSDDGPTLTYMQRCEKLISQTPEKWDGVFHAKSK